MQHPVLGEISMVNVAPRMSRTPTDLIGTPAILGEHNEEVLRELLEYSDADMAGLYERKVLYQEPSVKRARTGC
jgi:formyl-CoA transferase